MSLEDLKRDIYNLSNRTGVYYVSESEPEPKMGYKRFYDKLHNELSYPEKVKDRGVEGTVYVKFVVDSDGEVSNAILSDDIDADDYLVKALQKEAKEAVLATSWLLETGQGRWYQCSLLGNGARTIQIGKPLFQAYFLLKNGL